MLQIDQQPARDEKMDDLIIKGLSTSARNALSGRGYALMSDGTGEYRLTVHPENAAAIISEIRAAA